MTFTLKLDAVTAALEEVVAAKGEDYHYKGMKPRGGFQAAATCHYAEDDGSPSCIVGHVVAALDPELFHEMALAEQTEGFPVTELETGVDLAQYDEDDELIHNVVIEPVSTDNTRLWAALRVAQALQDRGFSWGEALTAYRRVLAGESSWDVEQEYYKLARTPAVTPL